ncbi:serine carboxypeptidase-like [Olea europaea subsp. europaea]|uniref:Carboxypeptidase n=1 Tax=Olea europaea subsp. europaea TaxID=158383 RepID=A0A8S0PCL5_OLEEU|nr:serine carboxypeptidase-like [Olea europaea subsp. europaea]
MEFPKTRAEKMIRGLNLFPELDVNIAEEDPTFTTPKIVEKSLLFPCVGDPTCVQYLGHTAGYYRLPHAKSARMFYYFFQSRNKPSTDPVVVYLTGGPGCSTSQAMFYVNGPFHITNNLSLVWNDFGWDKVSNIIYVDQPIGTGFSYTSDKDDIRTDSQEAAVDFYDFLQAFFEAHPQYARNDFYITGESYAGHYIPAFADRVQKGNNNKEGIHINMKGLAIGNGLTDPVIQYKAYTDFALSMKLITQSDYDSLNQLVPQCMQGIELCGNSSGPSSACSKAFDDCTGIFNRIVKINGQINYFDIRERCPAGPPCYNFSNVPNFLNQESVRQALGVGDIKFVTCNLSVYDSLKTDWMRNYEVVIPALLENGVKLLVYVGEYDLICNWLGNSRWVDAMVWSGQKNFVSAPSVPFKVDGVEAGLQKSSELLTFLKVYNAGHWVPMDQPKASLEMIKRWLQGIPL